MAQIDIDKFVISLRRCFGEDKGIATRLDRCLLSQGLMYVDTPTGGRLHRVDLPISLGKVFGEQKPAWSEEDETYLNHVFTAIKAYYSDDKGEENPWREELLRWLKFLKDRVQIQPQPKQEWSEEVEDAISLLKHIAEEQEKDYCPHNANALRKAAQYLETCRPQSTWKPSDEQLVVLNDIIIYGHLSNANERILKGLQEQLKKLREE